MERLYGPEHSEGESGNPTHSSEHAVMIINILIPITIIMIIIIVASVFSLVMEHPFSLALFYRAPYFLVDGGAQMPSLCDLLAAAAALVAGRH